MAERIIRIDVERLLQGPFGIAFYPPGSEPKFIYIANTDSVVRLPYRNGQTKAEGKPEKLPSNNAQAGRGADTFSPF